MAIQATFASMGILANKAISHHLLVENAYESNLLSDISRVNYLADHNGRTHLRPLYGLPVFVDVIYVFGYLRKENIVETKGQVLCTTGDLGVAKTKNPTMAAIAPIPAFSTPSHTAMATLQPVVPF